MKRLSFGVILALVLGVSATANADSLNKYQFSSPQTTTNSSLVAAKPIQGSFVGVEHPTQGQVSIIEEDGVKYLQVGADFQSDRGPALRVILHKSTTVDAKVQEGDYLSLGELQSFNGAQRYQIPNDADLSQYQSVAIWCEEFNATFGYATLN